MSDFEFLAATAIACLLVVPLVHLVVGERLGLAGYLLVIGSLTLAIVVGALFARSAGAQVPHRRCDFPWRHDVRARAQVIRCWAQLRGLDPDEAVRIAICESGLDLADFHWRDGYAGPFQQATRYWPARARRYGAAGRPATSVWANAKVSTGMARERGWTGGDWPRCGWA